MENALRAIPVRQRFSGIALATEDASVWDAPVISLLSHQRQPRAIYACPDPLEFGTFQTLPPSEGSDTGSEFSLEQQEKAEEMLQLWTSAVMQAEETVPRFKLAEGDVLLLDNFRFDFAQSFHIALNAVYVHCIQELTLVT
eukprot:COSAG02_NODE_442_length_22243_cov_20.572887_19_plen_141_part_00